MLNRMGDATASNASEYADQLLVGGKKREGSSGERFVVLNPATGSPLASVASAAEADIVEALDAAEIAFREWSARSPRSRSEILRRCFVMLTERSEAFARLITLENGKALKDSRSEVLYSAEFFRWYAEEAVRNYGQLLDSPTTGARIVVRHRPAGIAALITPWNYPAAMGARKIAPALAAGCTVVVKPASETPLTMLALGDLMLEAGVPPGVVNILPCRNSAGLARTVLHDDRVRVVSFTGSTAVGRSLLREAADKVVTSAMELGGNAPFIVCSDADVDAAVEGAMLAKMRNLGEACTAANRFYVHASVHDAFAERLASKMSGLRIGDGLSDGVDVGALVNAETRDKVARFVTDAVEKGARILTGGSPVDGPGFFYPPTVLSEVPDNASCLGDEIFGPVAAIQRFEDENEIVERANATEYGLTAYLYTADVRRGLTLCERLDFGMVGLNRGLVSDPAAPFGGTKQSGIGREGGQEGMREFMETQYISLDW